MICPDSKYECLPTLRPTLSHFWKGIEWDVLATSGFADSSVTRILLQLCSVNSGKDPRSPCALISILRTRFLAAKEAGGALLSPLGLLLLIGGVVCSA